MSIKPVSYTHLDVYKRQEYHDTLMLEYEYKNEEMEYINITILCKISKNLKQTHRKHKLNQALNLIPVSYTHLDVYKRQIISCLKSNLLFFLYLNFILDFFCYKFQNLVINIIKLTKRINNSSNIAYINISFITKCKLNLLNKMIEHWTFIKFIRKSVQTSSIVHQAHLISFR